MRDSDRLKAHLEGHGRIQDALRQSDVTRRNGWRDGHGNGYWRVWTTYRDRQWRFMDLTRTVRWAVTLLLSQ